MPKNPAQRKSPYLQPALPGTHDLHLVIDSMKTSCACICEDCPPWNHSVFDCRNECTKDQHPHRVIRGYTYAEFEGALDVCQDVSVRENETE